MVGLPATASFMRVREFVRQFELAGLTYIHTAGQGNDYTQAARGTTDRAVVKQIRSVAPTVPVWPLDEYNL
jgi:hypothetical protein